MDIFDRIRDAQYLADTQKFTDRQSRKAEARRLEEQFKADAIEHAGLTGHPKAEQAFRLAWDHNHATGLADVVYGLEELAELVRSFAAHHTGLERFT